MRYKDYLDLIRSDLHRYCGSDHRFFRTYFALPGFHYSFWLRTTFFLKQRGKLCLPLYLFSRMRLRRLQFRYGISIPYNTSIGKGLYIGHYGGIVVNHAVTIGCNCNLNQGVTVGATYGGKCPGTPTIGDNVYIGPGSFVIGGIFLGNHVAVGANTVVTKSVAENGVIASPGGEIISHGGSGHYVVNTDY